MKHAAILAALVLLAVVPRWAAAAEQGDPAFAASVAPVLKAYCVSCHGGSKPKSDLALDALAPNFAKNGEAWKGVLDRLTDGSMPPKGKKRPTPAEEKAVTGWVARGLTAYQAQKAAANGRARLRRLNRVEYVNTLRDLLGAEIDVETLPEDGVASGFDNVDAALDLSSTLLERYLETADAALDAVFVKGPRPQAVKRRIEMVPLGKQMRNAARGLPRFGYGSVVRDKDVVFFSENQPPKVLLETRTPAAGLYRFRISAGAVHPRNGKGTTFLVYAGNYGLQGLTTRLVGAFDVPEAPTVVEFTARMGLKESIRISPCEAPNLFARPAADYKGPGLAVGWVEMEGPLIDAWPPVPAVRLLGKVDPAKGVAADAEAILRRFAPRAFRRPVGDADLAPYFALVKSRIDKGYSFEAALRLGLKALLCSPDFLYLSATPPHPTLSPTGGEGRVRGGKLDDFDLAARLSYFLWSTTPDDALADLAGRGELGKPDVLRRQVSRMLKDARARAFTENFTGQWLSLRDLKATIPDKKLYPDFDDLLELSMPRETHLFFEALLKEDRSVLEFVHSDWTMLNERLARHYSIPGVIGSEFRKTSLPADSHRGGVMTQAAVLKVTANGTNTSPVIRGAWVLDRILGEPSAPPPKDVPAIEPDIRGAKTIREQLVKHRQIQSFAACHARIDPPGNALENFDVIGGWRQWYRVVPGGGKKRDFVLTVAGRRVPVGKGPAVAAGDELPGGRKFADVDGFKKLVLENPEPFVRGLTRKLLVYATGHPIEFSDRDAVEKIVAESRTKKYAFRSLIQTMVQSPPFRSK